MIITGAAKIVIGESVPKLSSGVKLCVALTKTCIVLDFSLCTTKGILPVDVVVIKEPLRAVVSAYSAS